MQKVIWDFIDNAQTVLLGMAVCAAIVYYKIDYFKEALDSWFLLARQIVTVVMFALFIASGWQAVVFISKNIPKIRKDDNGK